MSSGGSTPTPDPTAAQKARLENANLRLTIVATAVGIIIALIGLATTLGVRSNNAQDATQTAENELLAEAPSDSNGGAPTTVSDPVAPTPTLIYDEATLQVGLDGCNRSDDIDLDMPGHPDLESAAEVDFSSCMQGGFKYIFGKNGAVISSAAPPNADRDQCLQAVKEEPAGNNPGIELETAGQVICVVHYNKDGQRRVFRLLVQQLASGSPIVLSMVGWQ